MGSLEKQPIIGLRQGKYKVSIEEMNCLKSDRDMLKGNKNSLIAPHLLNLGNRIKMNNRDEFDESIMVLNKNRNAEIEKSILIEECQLKI